VFLEYVDKQLRLETELTLVDADTADVVVLVFVAEELRASTAELWSSAGRAIRSRNAFFIIRLHSSWQSWSFGNLDKPPSPLYRKI